MAPSAPSWLCVTIDLLLFCLLDNVIDHCWEIVYSNFMPTAQMNQLPLKYNDLIFGDKSWWIIIPTIPEHPKFCVWSCQVQVFPREFIATHIIRPSIRRIPGLLIYSLKFEENNRSITLSFFIEVSSVNLKKNLIKWDHI